MGVPNLEPTQICRSMRRNALIFIRSKWTAKPTNSARVDGQSARRVAGCQCGIGAGDDPGPADRNPPALPEARQCRLYADRVIAAISGCAYTNAAPAKPWPAAPAPARRWFTRGLTIWSTVWCRSTCPAAISASSGRVRVSPL